MQLYLTKVLQMRSTSNSLIDLILPTNLASNKKQSDASGISHILTTFSVAYLEDKQTSQLESNHKSFSNWIHNTIWKPSSSTLNWLILKRIWSKNSCPKINVCLNVYILQKKNHQNKQTNITFLVWNIVRWYQFIEIYIYFKKWI